MVSAREVRRFYDGIAPRYGPTINVYSAARRAESLSRFASGRILEIACGSGAVTRALLRRGRIVAGDISTGMAVVTARTLGVRTTVFDAQALPFAKASFDSVVCAEAVYYVDDVPALLAESFRVLVPGGVLALSCLGTFWQIVSRLRISAGQLGLLPVTKVPFTSPVVPVLQLRRWLVQTGFNLVSTERLMLVPRPSWNSLNRALERTPLGLLGFTCVLIGRKRGSNHYNGAETAPPRSAR